MTDFNTFKDSVDQAVAQFPANRLCRQLQSGDLRMAHYHAILTMIFHQTYQGPATFALAASHCTLEQENLRAYLLYHAEEEKDHWKWVISDLKQTGYTGSDPRQEFPAPACQAYVAFNVYTAMRYPLARLAIACVLESIGAQFGKLYSLKLIEALRLDKNQVLFFLGHGDTDVGHTEDLYRIIAAEELGPKDWAWMTHAAKTAGVLYRQMYDEAALC